MRIKLPLFLVISILTLSSESGYSQSLNCEFTVAQYACIEQQVQVTYAGNAPAAATYVWNFDGAQVISGSGQGPYVVRWLETGEKSLSLAVEWDGQNCSFDRSCNVVTLPLVFHMTGGGTYIEGGDGVMVGLSGAEPGIIYRLYRDGTFTGITEVGSINEIIFGFLTEPGTYTCKAKVDGSDCAREMEGTAVITIAPSIPETRLCMVSFDTVINNNILIWNRQENEHILQYNLYRETYQNNIYTKIGEVPYPGSNMFIDSTANPLVKSDRYKISLTDKSGIEHEKSPVHKTIHLNINPGIDCYNLIWNPYEGFEFLTYRIHRKIDEGPFTVIDSIASNVTSYTDFGVGAGLATYYIEVLRPEPCHPDGKSIDSYTSVISNTAKAVPFGIADNQLKGVSIYPNPVSSDLHITIEQDPSSGYFYSIIDPIGKLLYSGEIPEGKVNLDVSKLLTGLYFLEIRNDRSSIKLKVLKL